MSEFQIVLMVPKYQTIQARDLTDAGRQARMLVDKMNDEAVDKAILAQVTASVAMAATS